MNILFIAHEKNLNGASRSLIDLISILRQENNIHVLTAYQNGDFVTRIREMGIPLVTEKFYRWSDRQNIKARWIMQKIRWYIYANRRNEQCAKSILEYIGKNMINIVHTNTSVVDIGLRIKKYSDTVHIMHIREFGDIDFHMKPFVSYDSFYRTINNNTDCIICISQAIYQHYSRLSDEKKIVIYNGISSQHYIERSSRDTSIFHILVAGRISPEKGQHLALEACEKLLDAGICNFKLWIAGQGKIRIPTKLLKNVKYLGVVEDMPSLRRDMQIEIICSKAEAFGRVTAEAMMGGLAVVGSNSGGTIELISDSNNGFLFDNGNSDSLFGRLRFLLENEEVIDTVGQKAQEYALKKFTINRCAQEILCIYEKASTVWKKK